MSTSVFAAIAPIKQILCGKYHKAFFIVKVLPFYKVGFFFCEMTIAGFTKPLFIIWWSFIINHLAQRTINKIFAALTTKFHGFLKNVFDFLSSALYKAKHQRPKIILFFAQNIGAVDNSSSYCGLYLIQI